MGMEKYCDRCGKKLGDKESAPLSISFRDIAVEYEDVCEDCTNAVYRGLERVLLISLPTAEKAEDKPTSKTPNSALKTTVLSACVNKPTGGITKAEEMD